MTRTTRAIQALAAKPWRRTPIRLIAAALALMLVMPMAPVGAQDLSPIVTDLEDQGWYIEPGADGDADAFDDLVRRADSSDERWYFVSLAAGVDNDFADRLRDQVRPVGNVLVYFFDGEFEHVQLATDDGVPGSRVEAALAPFDRDWDFPEEFMAEVVTEFDRLGATNSTGSSGSGGSSTGLDSTDSSDSGGGGSGWLLVAIAAVLIIGGLWWASRRSKKKSEAAGLETAQKIRAELQTELDELANDVLVLSEPVDLCDKPEAVTHYREAAATYTEISDEIPDLDQLEAADLRELSNLGARVAHARWQMDAAEAIIDGEPIPEAPKVEPPPAPPRTEPAPKPRLPQRQPRPRVPYSRSRRRSGGGLLDILIAGAGMMGRSRGGGMFGGGRSRGGGMFGGSMGAPRSRPQTRSAPRSGGGVFGGGSSRSGRSSRSSTRSRSSASRSRSRSRSRPKSPSRSRRRSGGRNSRRFR